ncbi:large ribosomal subunit protein mL42 [Anabrus simplex]|uniref:large ribosomal subunit protein mL42 n=1 Tax=Anabrus simplex TaxID=316456 RepID=UPI0034DDC24F
MAFWLCQPMSKCFRTLPTSNLMFMISKQPRALFASKNSEEYVVMSDDGSTIVCWHPEPTFPYECSRPLPDVAQEQFSVLNVPYKSGVSSVMKKKSDEAVRQELMKITHTTKHRWFPRSRDKYFKKIPVDREYL